MIDEITEYNGFNIRHFKRKDTRHYFKIYRDGVFMQTSRSMSDATYLIDWCLKYGVRK